MVTCAYGADVTLCLLLLTVEWEDIVGERNLDEHWRFESPGPSPAALVFILHAVNKPCTSAVRQHIRIARLYDDQQRKSQVALLTNCYCRTKEDR